MSGPQGTIRTISAGGYSAEIAEVGASLVSLRGFRGHLVRRTPPEGLRPGCNGAILAPWPNRLRDGRYGFDGETHQLPLTEPERSNAAHGLVLWERWDIVAHRPHELVMSLDLVPQPGYPFSLSLEVVYSLSASGLECRVTSTNTGERPAPYAVAGHPYLVADGADGSVPDAIDDWTLTIPASSYVEADPERLLPRGIHPVEGTAYDFRAGRRLGREPYDVALGDPERSPDGRFACTLSTASGDGVLLECDAEASWIQVYTDDQPPGEAGRRAVAVEPMTAPADSFRSGRDLVTLDSGQRHSVAWRIRDLRTG
ncbi:aldose 1-epimerase family protein [Rothia koreensis]|uniref:aldose 1-epimerase family protein n=1 Tax=Rothia koreensis TaxID=592378 RepID=UPI003FCE1AAE